MNKNLNIKRQYQIRKERTTQTYLAKRLGVTQSYISQILSGYRPMPKKYEEKLKKILNEN